MKLALIVAVIVLAGCSSKDFTCPQSKQAALSQAQGDAHTSYDAKRLNALRYMYGGQKSIEGKN